MLGENFDQNFCDRTSQFSVFIRWWWYSIYIYRYTYFIFGMVYIIFNTNLQGPITNLFIIHAHKAIVWCVCGFVNGKQMEITVPYPSNLEKFRYRHYVTYNWTVKFICDSISVFILFSVAICLAYSLIRLFVHSNSV